MINNTRLRLLLPALLVCGLLLVPTAIGASTSSSAKHQPKAHAAASFLTGIGDEKTQMFSDPLWRQLHTRIARYIVPYDAAVRGYSLKLARAWIKAAEARHQEILIAFYHSEYTPTHMPSIVVYQRDVKKFMTLFPRIHDFQPWNEVNRGNVRYTYESYNSPTPQASAAYYVAVKRVCPHCTVLGLDILDSNLVAPTLGYISQFKDQIHRLHASMPTVWGLHNYSDTNRFESSRTKAILAAVPGNVWLTETGGIVKFGGSFPNFAGEGLTRASRALSYMFALARSNPRLKRLYIYEWTGDTQSAIFDAGLTDARHNPRPGYRVVCVYMHAARCNVHVSSR